MVAFFWRCNHQTWDSSGESYGESGDNPSEGVRQTFYGVFLPTKKGDGAPNMGGLTNKRIKIGVSSMRAESQQLVTCQTSGFNQQDKITIARNGDVIRSNAELANKHAERGFQQ